MGLRGEFSTTFLLTLMFPYTAAVEEKIKLLTPFSLQHFINFLVIR